MIANYQSIQELYGLERTPKRGYLIETSGSEYGISDLYRLMDLQPPIKKRNTKRLTRIKPSLEEIELDFKELLNLQQ